MKNVTIALILAGTLQHGPSWRTELGAAAISKTQGSRIVGRALPDEQKTRLSDDELMKRLLSARREALVDSDRRISQRDTTGAINVLVRYLHEYPRDEGIRSRVADIAFEHKRFDTMYLVLAPEIDWLSASGSIYRASLASALQGQAFKGQASFIEAEIRRSIGGFSADVVELVTSKGAVQDVALLSLIAIGLAEFRHASSGAKLAELYLSEAVRRDPGNPTASYALGQVFLRQNRRLEASIIFEKAIPRAQGKMKQYIEDLIKKAKRTDGAPPEFSIGG